MDRFTNVIGSNPNGDIDSDGKLNINDGDIDNDGISNGNDPDADGDGVMDYGYSYIQPNEDLDNDGIPNIRDFDIDGDGIWNGDDLDKDRDGNLDRPYRRTSPQNLGGTTLIGSCSYTESGDDDCADSVYEYSWTALWTWDSQNILDSNPDGTDYILGTDRKWHYDPFRKNAICRGGSHFFSCPAQIQLPFFGMLNLLAVMILVGLVYFARRKLR